MYCIYFRETALKTNKLQNVKILIFPFFIYYLNLKRMLRMEFTIREYPNIYTVWSKSYDEKSIFLHLILVQIVKIPNNDF